MHFKYSSSSIFPKTMSPELMPSSGIIASSSSPKSLPLASNTTLASLTPSITNHLTSSAKMWTWQTTVLADKSICLMDTIILSIDLSVTSSLRTVTMHSLKTSALACYVWRAHRQHEEMHLLPSLVYLKFG